MLLTVFLHQLDLCVIGKNVDFVNFFSNYVLSLPKTCRYMRVGRYNRYNIIRDSIIKILKEKIENLKTYLYRKMLIYRMLI